MMALLSRHLQRIDVRRRDINHWAYVMLFIDPGYYKDAIGFSQVGKLTGGEAQKLIRFIEQLIAENNSDILENVLIELLIEYWR